MAILASAAAGPASAATLTWDNGNGDGVLSTAANWDPDQSPAAVSPYDNLVFGATGAGTVTLTSGANANSIVFDSTAGAYEITDGAAAYSLALRGSTGVTLEDGAADQYINVDKLQLQTSATFTVVNASATLRIARLDYNGKSFTKEGAGTLRADYGWTPSTVNINAGTFDIRGSIGNTGSSAAGMLNGMGNITNGGTSSIILSIGAGTGNGAFGGTISGGISLGRGRTNNNDTGVQILSGNNTYTGTTTVRTGTLLVNGTHTGGDNYVVLGRTSADGAAGILGGSGAIRLAADKTLTLNNSSTYDSQAVLYPGANSTDTEDMEVGTAGNNNSVVFGNNAVFRVDVGSAGAADKLAVTGNVDLGTETLLDLKALAGAWDGQEYTILTWTGSRTGQFASISGLDEGYSIAYKANSVVLVPEPATLTLLGLGGLGALRRRRAQ